mgnify:FL=1
MKKKILIPMLIVVILIFVATIVYGVCYSNKNNEDILNASLEWYKDLDGLYSKTTIGTLYHYGYIKDNKTLLLKKNRDCQVIEIYQDKANFIEEENCNLNEELKKVPIIQIKMTNVSDNTEYRENTWTSSDVKVDVYFKNNQAPINISSMYITLNSQPIITENLIIKADENKNDTYTINLVLEDGSIYTKNFEILIDTTAPTYINADMSNNDFDAIFEDNESGIGDILYYVSNTTYPPTTVEQFTPKEEIQINSDQTYHVWAIATNYANINSEITYLGEYVRKSDNT